MSDTIIHESTRKRNRLGWAFLLAGFTIFVSLIIAIPLIANAFLQNTKELLITSILANQGTVRIVNLETSARDALLAGETGMMVQPGARILTDAAATALMSVFPPGDEQLLARFLVYGNTLVRLDEANSPRFGVSKANRQLGLYLQSGHLRLTLPEFEGRPFLLTLTTPQGEITIREPGQYSLVVTGEATQMTARDGRAMVTAMGDTLHLSSGQRAEILAGDGPSGPLGTERNLIRNGDFGNELDKWTLVPWTLESPDQPGGEVRVLSIAGEPTLHIIREGEGHAHVRLRQSIDQDVTDYESLQLSLTFRIVGQTLPVCGGVGSECPLFLRVDYIDEEGLPHTWQHGFYGVGDVVPGSTPGECVNCDVLQSEHEKVTSGQVTFYEVNLRNELARQGQGLPPIKRVESITLWASGHSFEVEVVDVALMVEE